MKEVLFVKYSEIKGILDMLMQWRRNQINSKAVAVGFTRP
jgi:hypothetical protein